MAQGRGNARAAATVLLILGLQSCGIWRSACAATHTVGGSQRWDVGIDYTTWAAGQTFKVGDILFFPYSPAEHNVVVVDKAGYDGCSEANAIATFNDGNTNVTLSTAGTHYYLCSVVGHCAAGMKLAVTVSAAAAPTPPPAPTTSPPTTSPSPSRTPSSSPITAPSTAPSSTPAPISAPSPSPSSPAPTPSAEAPASAPTPSSSAPVPTLGPPASSPSAPGSTPSSPGTPLSSPPPNSAPSFLCSAAIAPLVALVVAFTVWH